MHQLIEKALKTHSLNKEELVFLLRETQINDDLFVAADTVRKQFVGDAIYLRGLIEFSNICKNNCCYCGIRRDNKNVSRYRMEADDIVNLSAHAKELGFKTIVLQSGEDLYFDIPKMQDIISRIKKNGMKVTLSIGEKSFAEYKAYKEAGADRYLLRIETTDKDLYHQLDPGMQWEKRWQCLLDLRALGYEVGSGSMVGLPGQSLETIADDLLFFKELKIDMAGIGPFIPHPDTPLKDAPGKAFVLSLKVMALARLLLPDINIPATTAMEALHPQGRLLALQCGANVVMPNLNTEALRKRYDLYPGKEKAYDSLRNGLVDLQNKFRSDYICLYSSCLFKNFKFYISCSCYGNGIDDYSGSMDNGEKSSPSCKQIYPL